MINFTTWGQFLYLDMVLILSVRSRFGNRKLSNPLGTSVFGFETLNDAEPDANTMEVNTPDEASNALESMSLEKVQKPQKEKPSGGAAGKFKKKDKKKKKNKNF